MRMYGLLLILTLHFKFTIICCLETWSNDENIHKNSSFQLQGYNLLYRNINYCKSEGVILVQGDFYLKTEMTLK